MAKTLFEILNESYDDANNLLDLVEVTSTVSDKNTEVKSLFQLLNLIYDNGKLRVISV